jgi:hypothetical protein
MPLASVAEDSIRRHGCSWLNDDDAVENQIPERERSSKSGGTKGGIGSGIHCEEGSYYFFDRTAER